MLLLDEYTEGGRGVKHESARIECNVDNFTDHTVVNSFIYRHLKLLIYHWLGAKYSSKYYFVKSSFNIFFRRRGPTYSINTSKIKE